jgi:hypothetical protein
MYQCSESRFGFVRSVMFWTSQIRIRQRYGSEDPHLDPHQNVIDPQYYQKELFIFVIQYDAQTKYLN